MFSANFLLAYAVLLVVAVLLSGLARRSILSTSVLFLVSGIVLGPTVVGVLRIDADASWVRLLTEVTLFSVLFSDGQRIGYRELIGAWRLSGRMLLLGMPLTTIAIALASRALLKVEWCEAFLIGAVLSPTDPVFASAIFGQEAVPQRLRRLLNVESGVNDGLALPFVIVLLHTCSSGPTSAASLIAELVGGIALGIFLPLILLKLEQSRVFGARPTYQPLNAFSIGLLLLAISLTTGANMFLAAFAGGVTVATVAPEARDRFKEFGELLAELLKLLALLVLGALVTPELFHSITWKTYVFAAVVVFLVRPPAVVIALWKSPLDRNERIVAALFGPRGFASVVYGLLVLRSSLKNGAELFYAIAVVVTGSILVTSTCDFMIGRWFTRSISDQEA